LLKAKKILILLLLVVLALSLATGCNKKDNTPQTPPLQSGSDNKPADEPKEPGNENNQGTGENPAVKQDTGIYQGQADSNSIEIKISGVPEELSYKTFQLSDDLKEIFEDLGLEMNDQVRFTYTEEEGLRPVITEISKIN